ncbi:MAG: DUF4190 domain-containing protein [Oscillospiraceae bacterium]|nr:DUF4190 domain-containing protein [Oscillospiraceae bacterium]
MDYKDEQQSSFSSQDEAIHAAAAGTAEEDGNTRFSVVALVFGILSILTICCCGSVVIAPIGLLLSILALVKKKAGKNLAITGTVLSSLSLIVTIALLIAMAPIIEHSEEIAMDYAQLVMEQDEVFPQYENDKTLPSYLKKYTESPYSDYLKDRFKIDFYTIMDVLDQQYRDGKFTKPSDLKGLVELTSDSQTGLIYDGTAAIFE